MARYVDALCREVDLAASRFPTEQRIHTVYLGGGTPSHLPASLIVSIMDRIKAGFTTVLDPEITIEANPGTLDQEKLDAYLAAGINRISLGVQSTHEKELRLLERIHSYPDAVEAISLAKKAGFDNISLDLMYGLPGQGMAAWQETLERIFLTGSTHLSLYSLTVEEGTPLFDQVRGGSVAEPDPDLAGEMLEWAMIRLEKDGFQQYEISNWARKGDGRRDFRSKHNMQYWLNRWYLGLGVGAHEYYDELRVANVKTIPEYVQKMSQVDQWKELYRPAAETVVEIPVYEQMQDEMMIRFRLVEDGVDLIQFEKKFRESAQALFAVQIKSLLDKGLIEYGSGRRKLRLTQRGILMGNQVFMEFVGQD